MKILHLYHDLMNLYGDWANPEILLRELSQRGYSAKIEKKTIGDSIDFEQYAFIYIGSGTECSREAAMQDLRVHSEKLLSAIERGMIVLATGNSHELFGKKITDVKDNSFETLGLLNFETVQKNTRITGDCIAETALFKEKLIGFINRAGGEQKGEVNRPFKIVPTQGATYRDGFEGIEYKNLLGTYLTGPILLRNPSLLKYIADKIVNQVGAAGDLVVSKQERDPIFTYTTAAYESAIAELTQN